MIRRLALTVVALVLSTALAFAVPVTFTIGASTFSTTITGPNAQRGLAWATAAYPTIPNPAYDPNCDPTKGPCAAATLPNPDPVKTALSQMWQGIINNIQSSETATSKAAVAAPAPVN